MSDSTWECGRYLGLFKSTSVIFEECYEVRLMYSGVPGGAAYPGLDKLY